MTSKQSCCSHVDSHTCIKQAINTTLFGIIHLAGKRSWIQKMSLLKPKQQTQKQPVMSLMTQTRLGFTDGCLVKSNILRLKGIGVSRYSKTLTSWNFFNRGGTQDNRPSPSRPAPPTPHYCTPHLNYGPGCRQIKKKRKGYEIN